MKLTWWLVEDTARISAYHFQGSYTMEATIYVRPHGREGEVTLTCTENATIFYEDDVNFHGTDKWLPWK